MRACIITFQSAYNYGAILQAYALQKYLNTHYANTYILDYHNVDIDKSYKRPSWKDFCSNPKNAIFRLVQSFLYKGKNKKINKFRERYLSLTQRYDRENLKEAFEEADVFITGSDQVWNYLIIKRDSSFFLDFASGRRTCSYAASFGVSKIPEDYQNFYINQMKNIDFISVREPQGADLVRGLVNREVAVMPDPTLLINISEWEALCVKPKIKEPYILVYKITKADRLLQFSKELSKATGLSVIYVPNDLKSGSVGKLKLNVGPQEWLGLIKNAEYVVTNSFHGTVFSIIFGRKFFAEVSKKVNPSTSRLHSLLEMFKMEERTIDKYTEAMLYKELSKEDILLNLESQKDKANLFFDEVFSGVVI